MVLLSIFLHMHKCYFIRNCVCNVYCKWNRIFLRLTNFSVCAWWSLSFRIVWKVWRVLSMSCSSYMNNRIFYCRPCDHVKRAWLLTVRNMCYHFFISTISSPVEKSRENTSHSEHWRHIYCAVLCSHKRWLQYFPSFYMIPNVFFERDFLRIMDERWIAWRWSRSLLMPLVSPVSRIKHDSYRSNESEITPTIVTNSGTYPFPNDLGSSVGFQSIPGERKANVEAENLWQ